MLGFVQMSVKCIVNEGKFPSAECPSASSRERLPYLFPYFELSISNKNRLETGSESWFHTSPGYSAYLNYLENSMEYFTHLQVTLLILIALRTTWNTRARRVTWIMGVYGWSKLFACDNTQDPSYYIHYKHETLHCRIMYSYYTTPSLVCHSDSLFNVS